MHPVGSNGPFKEHADLPTDLSSGEAKGRTEKHRAKLSKKPSPKLDDNAASRAALEFTKEQKRREAERGRKKRQDEGTRAPAGCNREGPVDDGQG